MGVFCTLGAAAVTFSRSDPQTHERREVLLPGAAPEAPAPQLNLGEETAELLAAFASAQPIDLAEELAAGRIRQRPDGSYVEIDEEGRRRRSSREAAANHAEGALRTRETERAAWAGEVWRRKRSGRLFSRPGEPSRTEAEPSAGLGGVGGRETTGRARSRERRRPWRGSIWSLPRGMCCPAVPHQPELRPAADLRAAPTRP